MSWLSDLFKKAAPVIIPVVEHAVLGEIERELNAKIGKDATSVVMQILKAKLNIQ